MTETTSKPRSRRRALVLPRRVSLEAYFRAEDKAVQKNEFYAGIIRPMAGAKLNHNILASKAVKLLDNFVEDNDFKYKVSNSDHSTLLKTKFIRYRKREVRILW